MSQPRFVYAVFNFPGTTDEDLPLTAGERIEVLYRDDEFGDGWWEGINEAGQQGLFPKIYTSETYPSNSAGTSLTSLNESLARVEEEPEESESSADMDEEAGEPSEDHQTDKPSVDAVRQWSPSDVARYFENLGLGDVAPKFTEHEVSGRILLAMQHTDLREIDINAFGKRFEIMREIDILRHTEMTTDQYMHQLGTHGPVSTPPLDVSQRSAARKSRILPQSSLTPTTLDPMPQANGSHDKTKPLLPRSNSTPTSSSESGLAPALENDTNTFAQVGSASNDDAESNGVQGLSTSSTMPTLAKSTPITSLHRKSLSTSSLSLGTTNKVDPATGRHSPEKRHSRSWSQDTVKINLHKRGPSGGLDAVGEEAAASLHSTDSTPRSPSSTLASPSSAPQSSPSSSNRPALTSKKSLLGRRPKWRPNAVTENLENISAPDAAKDADFSGWLRKRGERSYNWKLRYFVLKGTRLAYFQSDRDTSEKGLIDINSHKVVMVDDILFYGPNRHTFKLVPPAPGASRALNFTPPKTHFFCADSKEQMRQWIAALTKATIGRDWSTPVISSCTTKTISLKAAREQRGQSSTTTTTTAHGSSAGLEPGIDLDGPPPPTPQVLSPDEISSQKATATTTTSGHAAADLVRQGSDSSLRRAVLGAHHHNTS